MRKVGVFLISLMSMLTVAMAQKITTLQLTVAMNNEEPFTVPFPETGSAAVNLTSDIVSSLKIYKAEATTEGDVRKVNFKAIVYRQDEGPSDEGWESISLTKQSDGTWIFDAGDEGIDLIESQMSPVTRLFAFYVEALDGSNNAALYNNGGSNYQVIFVPNTGDSDEPAWKVEFYSDDTAQLAFGTGTNNPYETIYAFQYDGNYSRVPTSNLGTINNEWLYLYSQAPNTTWVKFIYNWPQNVGIDNVSVQYRYYLADESPESDMWGEWPLEVYTEEEVYNYEKTRTEYRRTYTANTIMKVLPNHMINMQGEVIDPITPGDYILEAHYQVVTTDGDYFFLGKGKEGSKFRFTIPVPVGVAAVDAAPAVQSSVWYNTAGQLVDESYKGIVITGGKKYIRK